MSFLWRRRLSVVKIVILLSAVWFTIEFLIYSDDLRTSNIEASGPQSLELKYNNEFNDDNGGANENSIGGSNIIDTLNETVENNVILSNLNNNDNLNNIRNEESSSSSNIYNKHIKLNAQHRLEARKPASDDSGNLLYLFCWTMFLMTKWIERKTVEFFSL